MKQRKKKKRTLKDDIETRKHKVKKNGEPIKPQWRWCCGYRDALQFAKLMLPHAKTKRKDLTKIIKHYA